MSLVEREAKEWSQTGSNLVGENFLALNFEPDLEAGDRCFLNFHIFTLFGGQVIFPYGVAMIDDFVKSKMMEKK